LLAINTKISHGGTAGHLFANRGTYWGRGAGFSDVHVRRSASRRKRKPYIIVGDLSIFGKRVRAGWLKRRCRARDVGRHSYAAVAAMFQNGTPFRSRVRVRVARGGEET